MVIVDLVPGFSTNSDRRALAGAPTAPPLKAAAPWLLSLRNTRWDGSRRRRQKKRGRRSLRPDAAGRQDTAAHETQFPFGISQLLIELTVIHNLK